MSTEMPAIEWFEVTPEAGYAALGFRDLGRILEYMP
jgi:hypothetical protein